jgi:hypothetical protein
VINVILTHNSTDYLIDACVANSDSYRVYLCSSGSEQYLLQIASDIKDNGGLDRTAYTLRELKRISDLLEARHTERYPNEKIHCDWLFPTIFESFISSEHNKRRINILAFADIDAIDKMAPLSNLLAKDKVRISLETSAWIMGRLLKLLSFIHQEGISIQLLSGNNILIEPEKHRMILFDWSTAYFHQKAVPKDIRQNNISNAAKTVFEAIGGDVRTGKYPYEEKHPYVDFLWELACGREYEAKKTHAQFYKLVHELFGHGYIPSKILPL